MDTYREDGYQKVVLCGANSYEEKYYFNPDFAQLPTHVQEELQILCVLYVADVGGILTLVFDKEGRLQFEVMSQPDDFLFDEIGSRLKIKEIQRNQQDLLESLQMFYRVFVQKEEE